MKTFFMLFVGLAARSKSSRRGNEADCRPWNPKAIRLLTSAATSASCFFNGLLGSALLMGEVNAQSFAVTGHVVAGGGGTSHGSGFAITGTVGQADAAPRLQNGCWSIDPGFWSAFAVVQTPGAPVLRVRRSFLDYVRVSFTPDCQNWILQWATELKPNAADTDWHDDEPANLLVAGDELVRDFTTSGWGPRLFFRLRKP